MGVRCRHGCFKPVGSKQRLGRHFDYRRISERHRHSHAIIATPFEGLLWWINAKNIQRVGEDVRAQLWQQGLDRDRQEVVAAHCVK